MWNLEASLSRNFLWNAEGGHQWWVIITKLRRDNKVVDAIFSLEC